MLEHYHQHLRTATNRNGRPYAPKTISGYMRCAEHLARWLDAEGIEGDLTAACDPETLNRFFRHYLETHDQNGAAFVYRNLRNLFRWLEREEGVQSPYRSPELDTYVAREHKPKTLHPEFIRELLEDCRGKRFTDVRDMAIVRMLLEGVRVGELLAMTPQDVPDLTNPVVRLIPDKGELRYAEGSGRRILLDEETVKALHRYMRVRAGHPLAHTALRDSLWLSPRSALPLGYDGVRLMLYRRCKRLGYDQHATAHMFRHTFAHDYLAAGGKVDDLVHHMGWSGPAMAYRYGRDMAEDRAIEAKRRLGPLY